MTRKKSVTISRRNFVKNTVGAAIAVTIIPRHVMGGRNFIAPSDKIALGFIGTGKQARGLAKQFAKKPMATALAAADVDKQKLDLFKSENPSVETCEDFNAILGRKDIDAVVIAMPDHWHAVAAVMSAHAGKHIYCEKPMAHTVEEGRAMVKAVRKNDVIFQTGSMQRSWKNFRHACELVRNGYVGEIKEVLVSVGPAGVPCELPSQEVPATLNWDKWLGPAAVRPYNAEIAPPVDKDVWAQWRKYKEFGGGALSDWGAHMFDIAQWGLGMDRSGPVHFYPPDGRTYKTLTMVYANGVVMKHEDFGRNAGVRFIGSKGMLDISREYLDSDPAGIVAEEIKPGEQRLYQSDDHYQDWLDSIKAHKDPICDVETGHRSSSLCCLANIAYWTGRPLTWDPEKEKFRKDKQANKLLQAQIRAPWSIK